MQSGRQNCGPLCPTPYLILTTGARRENKVSPPSGQYSDSCCTLDQLRKVSERDTHTQGKQEQLENAHEIGRPKKAYGNRNRLSA